MRTLLSLALIGALLACGGSDSTSPQTGTLAFRFDQGTCGTQGSLTLEFFIDGQSKGTATLTATGEQDYSVAAGSHTAGARVTNTGFVWSTQTVTVPANGKAAYVLTCQ